MIWSPYSRRWAPEWSQLRKLIVGQWLLLLTLSVITGGVAGTALERLLLLVLKPVLPAALPAASGWPWLWAIGATGVISLLVGLRPYRLLLATLPLRVLRQDVVANVWPLKIWIPAVSVVVVGLLARLLGGSPLLWSVLAGAVVLALLCGPGGLGIAVAAQTPDAQSLAAASGGEPPAAPAVVDPQPAGGVFPVVYAAGAPVGAARRSA